MKRFAKSVRYATEGIVCAVAGARNRNMRTHVIASVVAIILGLALGIDRTSWIAVVLCIGIVMGAEMLNTSIEELCDLVQPEIDPRIKSIKDIAAGAVLVIATSAGICGLIIFIPYVQEAINRT
jgi:diacylglycerol kinase (ATP)